MKRKLILLLLLSVILLISLLFSACSSTSNDSNNNYNKENDNQLSESIELQSNKEAAMNAVYNYTYTFASRTHVSKVETVVITKCYLGSLDDTSYWIVEGHFYGKDSSGGIVDTYNFKCGVDTTYNVITMCSIKDSSYENY